MKIGQRPTIEASGGPSNASAGTAERIRCLVLVHRHNIRSALRAGRKAARDLRQ